MKNTIIKRKLMQCCVVFSLLLGFIWNANGSQNQKMRYTHTLQQYMSSDDEQKKSKHDNQYGSSDKKIHIISLGKSSYPKNYQNYQHQYTIQSGEAKNQGGNILNTLIKNTRPFTDYYGDNKPHALTALQNLFSMGFALIVHTTKEGVVVEKKDNTLFEIVNAALSVDIKNPQTEYVSICAEFYGKDDQPVKFIDEYGEEISLIYGNKKNKKSAEQVYDHTFEMSGVKFFFVDSFYNDLKIIVKLDKFNNESRAKYVIEVIDLLKPGSGNGFVQISREELKKLQGSTSTKQNSGEKSYINSGGKSNYLY